MTDEFTTFALRKSWQLRDHPNRRAISIHKAGIIGFGMRVYDELGKPEAVTLAYATEPLRIALRPVPRDTANSYLVTTMGVGHTVGAVGFVRMYGLMADHSRRFLATVENGVLVGHLTAELDRRGNILPLPRAGGPRTIDIRFRVNEAERQRLRDLAAANGQSMSAYIRAATGLPPVEGE